MTPSREELAARLGVPSVQLPGAVRRQLQVLGLGEDEAGDVGAWRRGWRRVAEANRAAAIDPTLNDSPVAKRFRQGREALEFLQWATPGGVLAAMRPVHRRGRDSRGRFFLDFTTWVKGGSKVVVAAEIDGLVVKTRLDHLPSGADVGSTWLVPRGGEVGDPPGDLVLQLAGVSSGDWTVDEENDGNLLGVLPVSYAAVYEGRRIEVTTPWGSVPVTLKAGAMGTLRVRGHGLRRPKESRGDLLLRLEVVFPEPGDEELLDVLLRLEEV